MGEGRVDGDIYGYTYDNFNQILPGVYIEWSCTNDSAFLGSDTSDGNGRYDIYADSWWASHDTHNLVGIATKTSYYPAYAHINPYSYGTKYRRDFYLTHQ